MRTFFSISILMLCLYSSAQKLPPVTQQQLETLADAAEDEQPKNDELLQQLDYFRKHPINLNAATKEELQSLQLLNDLQIENLLHYRNLLGKFISVYELQAVPTLDLITIQKLLPFITVADTVSLKENFLARWKGDQSFLFRESRVLERAKGYNKTLRTHYLGNPDHLLFRYRYQYKNLLYFGLVADKDPGEQFFKGAQSKGFDFYSVHFFVSKLGVIKSLAIGDYTVNLGQGLIAWQSLAFGKSSEVMSIKRQSPVLLPYRSAGETNFNRGIGITLQKKKWETTLFASYKKISGNINYDTSEKITSLLTSGYYRTPSEIANRYKLTQASFGGNITYQASALKIGVNALSNHLSIPLQKRNDPYNAFAFSGKDLFNASVDYSYTYRNIHFFGEAAADKNFHTAFVSGALISVDPKVDLSILYRNLQKEYQSFFGNAFTENALPINEKGIYTGVVVRPATAWQINAYADLFQFPWLRYRVNAPTKGWDYFLQLNYQPDKKFNLYFRYKNKNKPLDSTNSGVINFPQDVVKQNFRINISDQLTRFFFLQSRVEMLWYNKQTEDAEQGFLGFVEANYSGFKRLSSNIRLQYFETNSYNSRIYAYESDVLYSFSIPAFFDKGFRYYVNFNYDWKKLSLWFRWAQTIYKNKDLIGSGLDEIKGNSRSELKMQLLYKL